MNGATCVCLSITFYTLKKHVPYGTEFAPDIYFKRRSIASPHVKIEGQQPLYVFRSSTLLPTSKNNIIGNK